MAAGYAPYVVPAPYYKLVNRNSGKVVSAGSFPVTVGPNEPV